MVTKCSGRGNPDLKESICYKLIAEELGAGRHMLVNRAGTTAHT